MAEAEAEPDIRVILHVSLMYLKYLLISDKSIYENIEAVRTKKTKNVPFSRYEQSEFPKVSHASISAQTYLVTSLGTRRYIFFIHLKPAGTAV